MTDRLRVSALDYQAALSDALKKIDEGTTLLLESIHHEEVVASRMDIGE